MEYAIIAFIGVVIGFVMGRQATRDKQKIEANEIIDKPIPVPQKELEIPEDPIMEAFNNMMQYDGTDQGDE